ncbi:MAG TPA: SCO family protein [Rhizomicrobium sp.]|nr:SCO family protein [Rhizomicrobium sp.]
MKPGRLAALLIFTLLAACGRNGTNWHAKDITGAMPPLTFSLTRAGDGVPVHGSDYRGKVVVLYFGYTHCPDICPATLANLAAAIEKLGARADDVRVLFVTVDPDRDTPPILAGYARSFAPQVQGLRGTPDQLTDVARRYRVVYSVTPDAPGHPYEVMHSAAAFFFDRNGRARLVATKTDDVAGLAADLHGLLDM